MKLVHVICILCLAAGTAFGQIRIGGSDLLAPHFSKALSDYAASRDFDVAVDFSGSYPALEGLRKGEIDLAIVAIPDGQEVPAGQFRSVHVASKALAVVVAQTNPLNQLTIRQLAGIFGEAEATNFTRWGQLGLTGEWASRSIALHTISHRDHTLAVDLFRHQVLQSRNMKRNVAEAAGTEALALRMQQDSHGIALMHRVPTRVSGMKVLSIARGDTDLAVSPTPESIANDYPLRLRLFVVYPAARGGELRDLLRFTIGGEAAEAIAASDLVPLTDQRRLALQFEFERL
jgi:ABC-type phosphate transport system substrate-binding protein